MFWEHLKRTNYSTTNPIKHLKHKTSMRSQDHEQKMLAKKEQKNYT